MQKPGRQAGGQAGGRAGRPAHVARPQLIWLRSRVHTVAVGSSQVCSSQAKGGRLGLQARTQTEIQRHRGRTRHQILPPSPPLLLPPQLPLPLLLCWYTPQRTHTGPARLTAWLNRVGMAPHSPSLPASALQREGRAV